MKSRRRARSRRGSSRLPAFLDALDLRAQRSQALVDALVSALDLTDIVDRALPRSAERGEEDRHTGPDIRRLHLGGPQTRGTDDHGAMRIAENDARAHANEL